MHRICSRYHVPKGRPSKRKMQALLKAKKRWASGEIELEHQSLHVKMTLMQVGAGDKIHEKTKQIEDPYKEIEEEIRDDEDVKPEISETEQLDKDLNRKSRVNIIKGKFAGVKKKFGSESESKYGMKSEFRCEGRDSQIHFM
ncbi:e3 ubiquitin-protein ligase DCST1 [Trichonephila clavata]|uniref:E3 ubiquitin-protein ligase DCST1 n=1 Tax=Trichonephila clavata TaxID=2740835 RepID=A0A8X6GGL7_TRICU|nr:e3 ubiquitin-protein ligase DCST1 [Trichonephila clavata]